MKATTILRKLSQYPDLANDFGIIRAYEAENNTESFVQNAFGKGRFTGKMPENCEYVWIFNKENEAPISCPDFVIKADAGGYIFGYILD